MSDDTEPNADPAENTDPAAEADAAEQAEADWKRKRRLAEIFGDALPEVTRDERDPADETARRKGGESASDAWLKSQVPPHHG